MHCLALLLVSLVTFTGTPACASGSKEDVRTVTITALIDEEDFSSASRVEIVKGALNFSSRIFEKEFRVTFKLQNVLIWHYPAGRKQIDLDSADPLVKFLAKDIDTDIVLAFTSKFMDRSAMAEIDGDWVETREEVLGIASGPGLGRTAFVRITEHVPFTTLHELLHLFGALDVHCCTEETVMRRPDTSAIDRKNIAIVLANRERVFSKN